mmetsp:Transcript_10364/g.17069  ORF Transcript_10364/g.17069 Transcript_10364/m.17069 type:complete len:1070 (-) Transcript_10364:1053-4262(-)
MMVASEFTGNELWMYSDNDLAAPCAAGTSAVVLGNSLNDGETVYTRTPAGACSKLEMDATVAPPLAHCQSGNYTWQLFSDFQCATAVLASAQVNTTTGGVDTDTVYCIAVGSGLQNASLQCVSSDSAFSQLDLDYDGQRDSLLPHFLQNDLPIIGGSGAGAVLCFLLLLLGLHKYQSSGFVDFAAGDVVIYKLTPAQQKRQRIQNLTKGYDYIKDRGFALVVSVPAPRFLPGASSEHDEDPDATPGKQDSAARKGVLCLQPLRRVARPTARGPGHTDFFDHGQSPPQQRRGGMGAPSTSAAISLIRESEMELELTVDDSQRPVSSNYWGIRGGRVLSVVPILWRRRIKLEVPPDTSEVEERRRKGRAGRARGGSAALYDASGSASSSKQLPRKLEMLSFLDVTYSTNPVTGKGEWVSRASLARGLRRRSPEKDQQSPREDRLAPLSPLVGAGGRRVTMGKTSDRDTKFERRETKRVTALKEKRSKRESVRRTILTADRKAGGDAGLLSLLRGAIFKNSMSEAERKRMTKIQDESIRLSSMPRKLRTHAGRNDLAMLFGGKEAGKKVWENVANNEDDEDDEDEDDEGWWKHNSYEAEAMVLQPFLKSISRSETITGRQSAAGLGFSFMIENCRELELDQVAYSVWTYPYSPEEEERALREEEDEYFDSVVEAEPEDGGFPLQEADVSDEDDDDRYQPKDEDEDAGELFELQPPQEEPSHNRHRMRSGTQQQPRQQHDDFSGDSDAGDRDRRAYADFQKKSTQIREAESAQRSQKKSRKLTHTALQEHTGAGGGGSSRATPPGHLLPSAMATPSPSSHLSRHVQQSGGADTMQLTQTTPFQQTPSPSRLQVAPLPQQQTQQQAQQHGGGGDYYVTPPHRMKSIVSRSTKVSAGQQAALSNDSTKSNSADKQYLMRVGDGLAVQGGERDRGESSKDRERARHRNTRAEEHLAQQRHFAQDELAYQQQQRGAKLGSSLESDDDMDSAAVRQPGQQQQPQQQQQRTPPTSSGVPQDSSSKKKKKTPGRSTIMAKEGADVSQQAKQRRAERRRKRQEQEREQGTALNEMAVEEFE